MNASWDNYNKPVSFKSLELLPDCCAFHNSEAGRFILFAVLLSCGNDTDSVVSADEAGGNMSTPSALINTFNRYSCGISSMTKFTTIDRTS